MKTKPVSKTAPYGFRLDKSLLIRIEKLHPRLEKRASGVHLSRSAVVRALVEAGLEVLEQQLAKEE